MIIGVPTEVKNNENRVGLTPRSVKSIVESGHEVNIQEKNVLLNRKVLADIAMNHPDVFKAIIEKVK